MGEIREHRPALLIMAAFSRHRAALEWARETSQQRWGCLALESPEFAFEETEFYRQTMGEGLRKVFWAFEGLIDAATLPALKRQANAWEDECRTLQNWPERRPLNLDPGYLTEAKLVLASTKDRDHRLYLADGIFAEVTLFFRASMWQTRAWTYPDYQRSDYHEFFLRCREYLRRRYREAST
jgi:hypothetical protein